jgi:hypothetical protein
VYERLAGLARLCVTRSGEAAIASHIDALAPYLEPFPAAVALDALDRWPTTANGKWYPTAHELDDICRMLAAQARAKAAATHNADADADPQGRYSIPTGRAASAVGRITGLDAKFAGAWFKPRINVQYRPETIYTTGIGFARIAERFAVVLDEEGVALVACPQVRYMLTKHDALTRNLPTPDAAVFKTLKREVRRPRPPETLEERRAVVAALRAAGLAPRPGAAA